MNNWARSKILVVDDDASNLEAFLELLTDRTFEVIYAPNGERALSLARNELPDLIIMDWEMPGMDGIEVLQELKKSEATQEIPTIIATGVMISSENLKKAFDAGAVDFLRKPVNPIEFKSRVNSTLSIKQQQERIRELLEKEKELINQALEQKNRELSALAMHEYQKGLLISKLLEEMIEIESLVQADHKERLRTLVKELKASMDLDKSWNDFKIHFEEVHPSFFKSIAGKHNGLSTNEVKMLAYLKIGLGNFEIARLSGVADASVRKALNRLKKKLELNSEESLRDYIGGF